MENFEKQEWLDRIDEYLERRYQESEIALYDKLTDFIISYVKQMIDENRKNIMTAEETAVYLDVTKRTLTNWAKDGTLPRYELGGKHYWKATDIHYHMALTQEE